MDNEKLIQNLSQLLEIFKDRPYHLANYLLDNNALNKTFKNKIIRSKTLNTLNPDKIGEMSEIDFSSYDDMNNFFNNIIEKNERDNKVLENELNNKLKELLVDEDYQEAAKLRDYMLKKNIKIIL